MTCQITLTDEQLAELEVIVNQDLASSRHELHRTWNSDYKAQVKRHIELAEHILSAVQLVRGRRPVGGSPAADAATSQTG